LAPQNPPHGYNGAHGSAALHRLQNTPLVAPAMPSDMDRVDKDSLEYVLWCAKIHVVDLLAQLRDDGEIPVVELVERLTKLLGLLQETEAKAQGKPPGG
jgi:hypothetical protein